MNKSSNLSYKWIQNSLITVFFLFTSSNLLYAFDDIDQDLMPDSWEQQFGLDSNNPTDAMQDPDLDEILNIDEFIHGSNPFIADLGRAPDYYIYWDGILNEWWDQSANDQWQSHLNTSPAEQALIESDLHSSIEVYSGNYALAMEPSRWRYLNLLHNNIDISLYEELHFYINGGPTGGQNIKLMFVGSTLDGTEQKVNIDVTNYLAAGVIHPNTWQEVSIPLSDLLTDNAIVSRLNIGWPNTGSQSLYYLDEIKLVAKPSPSNIVINIKSSNVIGDIPKELLGSNGGYWVTNMDNTDLVDKTIEAGFSTMRYPGGNLSDTFHLNDWNNSTVADWITTPDEFLSYLANSQTEGVITTNFGTGSANEAADFVYYANSLNSANIPFWEIGNEIYEDWQTSWTHDGSEYMNGDATHDGANEYCIQMKAVDPNIKVAMIGPTSLNSYSNFAIDAIDNANSCFDLYSFHYYPQNPSQTDYIGLLSSPSADIALITDNLYQQFSSSSNTQNLKLAMTEYNSYSSNPPNISQQVINMLFIADVIGQAASNKVAIANQWFIGGIPTAESSAAYGVLINYLSYDRQPSYFAFPLWNKMGDELIEVNHNLDPALELAVYASRDSSTGDLIILAINKTGKPLQTQINLGHFQHDRTMEVHEAAGLSLSDTEISYNNQLSPSGSLSSIPARFFPVRGRKTYYSFNPYSITVLKIKAK